MICFKGQYYIALDNGYSSAIMVPFEDAEKAMVWLEGVYSRLNDVRQKMTASGVREINKKITIEVPDMLYRFDKSFYFSHGNIDHISSISSSEVRVDRHSSSGKDRIVIQFNNPYYKLTVSVESYHAMMAALKSRNEMKRQLDAYMELGDSIY
jgi:alpha-galactosidase